MGMNDGIIGQGVYPFAEASRLLRTQLVTLRRWLKGYSFPLRDGSGVSGPVVPASLPFEAVTFHELVELFYVKGFRDLDVPLQNIRAVADCLRAEWNTPHPFATRKVFASQSRLVAILEKEWEHPDTTQKALAFVDELVQNLEFDSDSSLADRWRPLGKERTVVLDPLRSFGEPIDFASGVSTAVLSEAAEVEGDEVVIAEWYGTTVLSVQDAMEFERKFAA